MLPFYNVNITYFNRLGQLASEVASKGYVSAVRGETISFLPLTSPVPCRDMNEPVNLEIMDYKQIIFLFK